MKLDLTSEELQRIIEWYECYGDGNHYHKDPEDIQLGGKLTLGLDELEGNFSEPTNDEVRQAWEDADLKGQLTGWLMGIKWYKQQIGR